MIFSKFSGIDNVSPNERLPNNALAEAVNVDIDLTNRIVRRKGHTLVAAGNYNNLFEYRSGVLATLGDDLVYVADDTPVVLRPSFGNERAWYARLPDGRAVVSNGTQARITNGTPEGTTPLGVPLPASIGAVTQIPGELIAGEYRYALTLVRQSDGLEGGAVYSAPSELADGGLVITGLTPLEGYRHRLYLTSKDGAEMFLAAETTGDAISYVGTNSGLTVPLRTGFMYPMPIGTVMAMWRGRLLVAVDSVLYASRPFQYELCDTRRDYKQFTAQITAIVPVDDGVYIGTKDELAFLSGTEFDKLTFSSVCPGPVVLGSGISISAELLGEERQNGSAAIAIANGVIVYGFNGGSVIRKTEGRYRTGATEVYATVRQQNGYAQYVAVPR